jgi:hypothetical protein
MVEAMGRVLGGACVAALCALAACGFDAPSPTGTSYTCAATERCPDGFTCIDGVCRAGADATPRPDAAPTIDAGPPADAGPTTLTFGERAGANVFNVATDVSITSETPPPVLNNSEVLVDGAPYEAAGLMAFDLSAIPRGARVLSADLTLYVFDPYRPYSGESTTAQVLTVGWNEDAATWTQAAAGVAWPRDGAKGTSVGATVVESFAPEVDKEYTVPLVVAPVQAWVDDPSSNHGMRWRSNTTSSNNLRWRGHRSTDPLTRPMLRVTFQP